MESALLPVSPGALPVPPWALFFLSEKSPLSRRPQLTLRDQLRRILVHGVIRALLTVDGPYGDGQPAAGGSISLVALELLVDCHLRSASIELAGD